MRFEFRVIVFSMTLLVAAPALYALGDWVGGLPMAVALPATATLASFLYARSGESTQRQPLAPQRAPDGAAPGAKGTDPTRSAAKDAVRPRHAAALVIGSLALGLPAAAVTEGEAAEHVHRSQRYSEAQIELEKGNHARALSLLEEYLDFARGPAERPARVFAAVDRVAQLYLGARRDPDGALAFFGRIRHDPRLTEIDRGAIEEWITVAEAWKAERAKIGTGLREPAALFERGRRYFDSGVAKTKTGIAAFAKSDFDIATGYLLRFAILYDQHPRIGDALYMLGAIRHHARADDPQWSDNFYLKESIRRFPHTPLAGRAYGMLRSEVGYTYEPTAIPAELAENLSVYEELARPVAPPT